MTKSGSRISLWPFQMETFSASLCGVTAHKNDLVLHSPYTVPLLPSQRDSNANLWYFLVVSLNKLLNRHPTDLQFQRPWWPFDVAVVHKFPLRCRAPKTATSATRVSEVTWPRSRFNTSGPDPLGFDCEGLAASRGTAGGHSGRPLI